MSTLKATSHCWWVRRLLCGSFHAAVSYLSWHSQGGNSAAHRGLHWLAVGGNCSGRQLWGGAGAGGLLDADNHSVSSLCGFLYLVFLFARLFLFIHHVALKFTFKALQDLSGGEGYKCAWPAMESLWCASPSRSDTLCIHTLRTHSKCYITTDWLCEGHLTFLVQLPWVQSYGENEVSCCPLRIKCDGW